MTNRIGLRISTLFLLVTFSAAFACPHLVEAKPPTQIELDYNEETEILFVNVTHQVPNPKNHYIELIEVFKNSVFQFNRTYPEQEFNYGLNDTFTIAASSGDNLTVTATCSRGHSLSGWTIASTSTTSGDVMTTSTQSTTTSNEVIDPLDPSLVIGTGLVVVAIFMIALVLYKEGFGS